MLLLVASGGKYILVGMISEGRYIWMPGLVLECAEGMVVSDILLGLLPVKYEH